MASTQKQTYSAVTVLAWEFRHYTLSGVGVYNFTIQTIGDEIITGQTQGGIHQEIRRDPKRLTNVTIAKTPSGRIRMIAASN